MALAGGVLGVASGVASAATSETPRTGVRSNLTFDEQRLNDRHGLAVNVANGNLVVRASDVRIAGRAGFDLQIARTYNGLGDDAPGTVGRRWALAPGLDTGMETLADGTRVWHGLIGEVWRFAPVSGGGFSSPAAINASLTVDAGGSATITEHRSGRRFEFGSGSPAKLESISDRNGNTISLSYSGGRLSTITDTQGRELVFAYDASGDLDTITDPTGPCGRMSTTATIG